MKCFKCKQAIKLGEVVSNRGRSHFVCPERPAKRSPARVSLQRRVGRSASGGKPEAVARPIGRKKAVRSGVELIADERLRQTSQEGWTPEHDDKHRGKQLAKGAESYLCAWTFPDKSATRDEPVRPAWSWPWSMKWWKPSNDPIRNLVKAGALIAAEIDRLQRKQAKTAAGHCKGQRAIPAND